MPFGGRDMHQSNTIHSGPEAIVFRLCLAEYCRGLTRANYILSIEHLRMSCLSRESNPGPPALQASTLWKEPFERPYLVAIRDLTCVATAPPQVTMGDRGWIRLRVTYAWRSDRMHVAAWELCITSGSPLCRGLTRAIYILSIEHLRMSCLSRESNPGPPALQASTLWKEPFERPYLVAIRDLTCVATIPWYFLGYSFTNTEYLWLPQGGEFLYF